MIVIGSLHYKMYTIFFAFFYEKDRVLIYVKFSKCWCYSIIKNLKKIIIEKLYMF